MLSTELQVPSRGFLDPFGPFRTLGPELHSSHHQLLHQPHNILPFTQVLLTLTAAMDALRSALQPITHNLPTPIRNLGLSLLGPHCYQTLLHDIDPLSDPACLKLAISKGLGIGIIGASSIVKIPQLLKLLNSQSSEGISFLSYALETSAYLIGLAYNVRQGFPFSTYGETALIVVQNIVIAALVLQFAGRTAGAAAWVAGLAAAGYALFDGRTVDAPTLSWLQAGAGVLGVASKAPQIWTNWRQGGTGQLSAFAVRMKYREEGV